MRVLHKSLAPWSNCVSTKQTSWFIFDTHYLWRKDIDRVSSITGRNASISWVGGLLYLQGAVLWNRSGSIRSIYLDLCLLRLRKKIDNSWKLRICTRFFFWVHLLIQANQLSSRSCFRNCRLWHGLSINLECKTV